ncbi:hypothetical protein KZ813_10050 [Sphingomonas sp. RHCKR7]|nr:hypothetical protein [Sphingomonas folli]MBW6527181.1 hypothetical protein [Sphingomonas folli]
MIDVTRELVAYAIIGAVLLVGIPSAIVILRRRHRQKLRRRGIKRYGH